MTDEDPELVSQWVDDREPTYPVVILKDGKLERFLGVQGFPTAAVIAPDGTLAYVGSSGAVHGPLGDALDDAERGYPWPKALEDAMEEVQEGDLPAAYAEVRELLEKDRLEEEEKADAEELAAWLEGRAERALAKARERREAGFLYDAVTAVEPFAEAEPAFPVTEEARKLLEEMEAVPDFKAEMKGGEDFLEAKQLAREGEYVEAIEAYLRIARRYDETRIAANARAAAEELVRSGMAGYRKSCPSCAQARKACESHHEEIDLD